MFTFDSNTFRLDFQFNQAIDFCIWILEIDGLKVAPFNQHTGGGNSFLSQQGMDVLSWKNWLSTVVALQDPILTSKAITSQQSLINENLIGAEKMIEELRKHPEWANEPYNGKNEMSNLATQFEKLQQQYQTALSAVKHLPQIPSYYLDKPFEAFPGSKTLKESLKELWQEYQEICQTERIGAIHADKVTQTRISDPNYRFNQIEYLNIYLVKYQAPAEEYFPPVSVIVASAKNLVPKTDNFYLFVENCTKKLIQKIV